MHRCQIRLGCRHLVMYLYYLQPQSQSRYGRSWYLHPMSIRQFRLAGLGQMNNLVRRFQFAVKSRLGTLLTRCGCLLHGGKNHLSYLRVLSSYQTSTGYSRYQSRNPCCKTVRSLQALLYQSGGCNGRW